MRGFLEELGRRGWLVRLRGDLRPPDVVRALLEYDGRSAVLFEPRRGAWVAGNLFFSRASVAAALGVGGEAEVYERLLAALEEPRPLSPGPGPELREVEGGLLGIPAVKFYLSLIHI